MLSIDDGIDTRIHGIKIRSSRERDLGLNRDLFGKDHLSRFPKLDSFTQETLYRWALILLRWVLLIFVGGVCAKKIIICLLMLPILCAYSFLMYGQCYWWLARWKLFPSGSPQCVPSDDNVTGFMVLHNVNFLFIWLLIENLNQILIKLHATTPQQGFKETRTFVHVWKIKINSYVPV